MKQDYVPKLKLKKKKELNGDKQYADKDFKVIQRFSLKNELRTSTKK